MSWKHQKTSSSTGHFFNKGVAMSNDGMYFYSIDKGSLEIAVGTLFSGDDDSYEDDDDDYYEDDNDTEEVEISNEQDVSDGTSDCNKGFVRANLEVMMVSIIRNYWEIS